MADIKTTVESMKKDELEDVIPVAGVPKPLPVLTAAKIKAVVAALRAPHDNGYSGIVEQTGVKYCLVVEIDKARKEKLSSLAALEPKEVVVEEIIK